MRNLIKEAGKSQDPPNTNYLEDPVHLQQTFCDSRVVIINTGKRSLSLISGAVCYSRGQKSEQSISAPDVTRALRGALFRGISNKRNL